jgi:HxlR-like helix-turn-helix
METKQQTQPDIFQANCLSRQALGLIADQWTPLVIYALEEGTMRFGQLLKRIDGISKKMLYQAIAGDGTQWPGTARRLSCRASSSGVFSYAIGTDADRANKCAKGLGIRAFAGSRAGSHDV